MDTASVLRELSGKARPLKVVMFGAGELGREVFREARRSWYELVAVDRYQGSPAARVADREYVFDMLNGDAVRHVVETEEPDVVIPEIEAIDTEELLELERDGWFVVPNAEAARVCMDRKLLRERIAEQGVPTSPYTFVETGDPEDYREAVLDVGLPAVSKAVMSSSGKGSHYVHDEDDVEAARLAAKNEARGRGDVAVIEGFVDFDVEVTAITTRHLVDGGMGVTFAKPVWQYQTGKGDYHGSGHSPDVADYLPWGPDSDRRDEELAAEAEERVYDAAEGIVEALGGAGVFGVELFVKEAGGEVEVLANEVSPRPHDTGMVTYLSHRPGLSEGGLHLRAVTGREVPFDEEVGGHRILRPLHPAASHALKAPGEVEGYGLRYRGLAEAERYAELYLFDKPFAYHSKGEHVTCEERMGVALARGHDLEEAVRLSESAAHAVEMRAGDTDWSAQDEDEGHFATR